VGRIGILGGTFNPPHLGHLAVARHALAELGLDRVVLMPAGSPLHKPAAADPGPRHRLEMCRLAVRGEDALSACALEVERSGPSYTVDTLRAIHASHPDAELTFIVGADTAATLASWRAPAELLALARLAVASRSGSDRDRVLDTVAGLAGPQADERERLALSSHVDFLAMDTIEVSSSGVRARAAGSQPLDGLVDPGVARYIAEHELYRGASEVLG
jgi:nicotinate-nucleotide adenylyltransferase